MKKVFIIIAVILVFLVGISFIVFNSLNKEKTPITAEEFKTIMESKEYTITDATSQFEEYSYVEKAYVAISGEHQIEFYVLSSNEYAIGFYNTNKSKFESLKGNTSGSSSVNIKNYSKYSLTANSKYKYLSRIDSTVVYVDVDTTYKKDVKDVIKKLGY